MYPDHYRRLMGVGVFSAPVPTATLSALDDDEQLAVLITAMRESAQDTLSALRRAGYRIVRDGEA